MADQLPILVVDDDRQMLKTICDILRLRDYAPVSAATAQEALSLAGRAPTPAIALVDLRLPDMDGIELVGQLRSVAELIEVLILTGNASVDSAVRALREHSYDYLIKPVQPDQLLDSIGRAGERWQRRRAEAALRKSEEQLRQAQKMEAVGQLAGGVAHDFNNLLTVITGYSAMLLEELDETDPRRQDVEEIKRAAERAAALTTQLLAFSRKQVMQPRVLDLNEVVANVEKMLRRLIGEDIELVTALGQGLGHINADPGQLEQVIVNLAVNARDAMPEGGRLIIQTAAAELSAEPAGRHIGVAPGHYVMLAVSDTGTGMSPETVSHIFEPFFTTKEQGKGTGLGLSTVYGIVKQSGGDLWVYSEPGHGTSFKIFLPRLDDAGVAIPHAVPTGLRHSGTETVLLVEDDGALRALTRRILEARGYAVLEARDAQEALALHESHDGRIDLIATDVVMPGMSGRVLVEHLTSGRPGLKVLFMSGYTDDDMLRRGIVDPRMAFLQKPFTPEALTQKVRDVLDAGTPAGLPALPPSRPPSGAPTK